MKISMQATNKRLENAKYKGYVLCKGEGEDWIVIVPFEYFMGPRFLITKGNNSGDKGLFIEGEGYIYRSKKQAIEKGKSEALDDDGRTDFAFDFIS